MRLEQLTFTRFIAAIPIVVFHFGRDLFPFNYPAVSFIFNNAFIGVSFFFLLSGFVMIIAYGRNPTIQTGNYYKNRFARVYPVYFLAIIILFLYRLFSSEPIDVGNVLLATTLLQGWIPGKALSFNSPGWSLVIEFFFYALFPLFFNKIYTKFNLNKLILPISLFWLISQLVLNLAIHSDFYHGYPSASHDLFFYFPLMHLSGFLIGNLAGLYYLKHLGARKYNMDWYIICFIFILLILLKYPIGLNYHNGLLAIIFLPLILLISMNSGLITKFSNLKPCVFLGEISYGIYILQEPIYIWVRGILSRLNINNAQIGFYFPLFVLLLFSSLSYLYFEKPIRTWIKNLRLPKPKN